ncbi:hypothetical protein OPV22_002583 [Ensete ventricosum]|uniref:Uncharacterized protein n=1 Tax=Ensete ventricosum TaxID=4639 RepID=A0AAV8RYD4_ENSVE|nr:hypothetical protein OPV22_002583 [Ensete ventricosum]
MKLVWCPENAAKAYIDAVKALADRDLEETNVAELVAAMAGGWRSQLIVEACLAMPAPPPASGCELSLGTLEVDTDEGRVLREVRPGPRGMVVVRKGAGRRRGGAAAVFGSGTRVVRSTYLPIGSGMEVLDVGVGKGPSLGGDRPRCVRHLDHYTKEEHVFRRR